MAKYDSNMHYIVDSCMAIINNYSFLDTWNIEFFTKNQWDMLPSSWKRELQNVEVEELISLLKLSSQSYTRVWPLSLLCLCTVSSRLSLPRVSTHNTDHWSYRQFSQYTPTMDSHRSQQGDKLKLYSKHSHISDDSKELVNSQNESLQNFNDNGSYLKNLSSCNNGNSDLSNIDNSSESNNNCFTSEGETENFSMLPYFTHTKFLRLFQKSVKLKKRHEVHKMAKVTSDIARVQKCEYVIDIGSGVGHLARMLAYGFGLKVCCLESNDNLSTQARILDDEFEKKLSKYLSTNDMTKFHKPVHINFTLNSKTVASNLLQVLDSAFNISAGPHLKFGIVGLHPCGDLGPILLKLFSQCSSACFINVVGCCYMKLTTSLTSSFTGFPLSNYLITKNYLLSNQMLDLACHALEQFTERLQTVQYCDLKVHCYRAVLETIILKHWPHLQRTPIKNIKHSSNITFTEFCKKAINSLHKELGDEEFCSDEINHLLQQWKLVITFCTLRLLVAPFVETVILLDRLLYLEESGIRGCLLPLFDPDISARNQILIATKSDVKETGL